MVEKIKKIRIQEGQYKNPYHWDSKKRVEFVRYEKLSDLISIEIFPFLSKKLVIYDLGCGDGRNTISLAKKFRGKIKKIIGADFSNQALNWAKRKKRMYNIKKLFFRKLNITSFNWAEYNKNQPCVFILREVLEHLDNKALNFLFKNIKNIKNKLVIITVPSENSPVAKKHYQHFNQEKILAFSTKYSLKIKKIYGFGLRPKSLYTIIIGLKALLNKTPYTYKILNPLWVKCDVKICDTIVTVFE